MFIHKLNTHKAMDIVRKALDDTITNDKDSTHKSNQREAGSIKNCFVLYCVGDIKDAARDTNSLYHRKYLLHGWQQAISQPRGLLLVQYV